MTEEGGGGCLKGRALWGPTQSSYKAVGAHCKIGWGDGHWRLEKRALPKHVFSSPIPLALFPLNRPAIPIHPLSLHTCLTVLLLACLSSRAPMYVPLITPSAFLADAHRFFFPLFVRVAVTG